MGKNPVLCYVVTCNVLWCAVLTGTFGDLSAAVEQLNQQRDHRVV